MDEIRVLFAEDELSLAHIVRESLEERGFNVILCPNGQQALEQFNKHKFDILVLDVMMPVMDGFELARKIRETDKTTPIIFLTAKSQVKDVVSGFEIGANDYLKKPFSVEELIVRIKVLLSPGRLLNIQKTNKKTFNETFQIGSIIFNPSKNNLQNGLNSWELTSRESDLLYLICQYNHETIPRSALLQKLWGDENFFNARSLDVFISKLRNHLKTDPHVRLITIRSVGYKLVW